MTNEVGAVTAWMRATSLTWCGPERRLPGRSRRGHVSRTGACWRPPSCTRFAPRPPGLRVIRGVLREVYGARREGRRNVPSAGALYALRLAVVPTSGGVVHELAGGELCAHAAPAITGDEIRGAVFHQIEGEAALVIVGAELDAYVERYALRGVRYALLEAGHVVQEAIRCAAARGLAACPLGSFDDEALRRLLGARLSATWPLYALALGRAGRDTR